MFSVFRMGPTASGLCDIVDIISTEYYSELLNHESEKLTELQKIARRKFTDNSAFWNLS